LKRVAGAFQAIRSIQLSGYIIETFLPTNLSSSFQVKSQTLYKIPIHTNILFKQPNKTSKMAFFPQLVAAQDFGSLLRALEQESSAPSAVRHCQPRRERRFQPSFDVRETREAYELRGELPGIEQEDINIEFVDAQTLSISGRTERSFTSKGKAPATEETTQASPATVADDKSDTHSEYRKPSVEEESDYEKVDTPTTETETAPAPKQATPAPQRPTEEAAKVWVSERSTGAFKRTFTFPAIVDHESVSAGLKNGVLSVFIPKKQPSTKKIVVQ
jgi:HSP20 family protein